MLQDREEVALAVLFFDKFDCSLFETFYHIGLNLLDKTNVLTSKSTVEASLKRISTTSLTTKPPVINFAKFGWLRSTNDPTADELLEVRPPISLDNKPPTDVYHNILPT
jgi:hypothetical protein